jgi:hypothetical protein
METDLNRLIDNAVACDSSLSLASKTFVDALEGMREASLKCDRDLQAKQAEASSVISGLRSQIQELRDTRHREERELAILRKQIDHDRRNAGHELELAQKQIEHTREEIGKLKAEALKLFDKTAA